jgi:antitoxin component of RelBE/YafQ-DinJ toxin-antitoxin module
MAKSEMFYFRVDEKMAAEIAACAEAYDVNQSELARMAVQHFLRNRPIVSIIPQNRIPQDGVTASQ